MSGISLLIPVLLPIIGGYLSYAIGLKNKKTRDIFALSVVIVELIVSIILFASFQNNGATYYYLPKVAGLGLSFDLDGFRSFYVLFTAIMWVATTTVSSEYFDHGKNRNRYYLFNLLTLGMTMGVFLSADLYTTFIFFELMSFVSYIMVAQEENPDAVAGGKLYLSIAVFGGMIMLIGLMVIQSVLGTVEISALHDAVAACDNKTALYVGGVCATVGFAAKAGAYPLHIWLPKAHAVAPAPASAILSGILTKTGIFGILIVTCRIFAGCEQWYMCVLIIGVITMLTGALLALFSINIKRTLACSSVSQIGFILTGIAMMGYSELYAEEFEHPLVLSSRGTILFMINHTLVKMLLFLVAGMIYHNMHSLDMNDLRGFGRNKPLLHAQFIVGAFSLMGIPGTCGFIAKSFIHETLVGFTEIAEETGASFLISAGAVSFVEKLFLIGSGMTAAYMIKLYIALFVEKNSNPEIQAKMDSMKPYMSIKSELGLCIPMAIIVIIGLAPHNILDVLANQGIRFMLLNPVDIYIPFFVFENVKGIVVCALIGVVIYFAFIRTLLMKDKKYINAWPFFLDMEKYLYIPLIQGVCFIGRVVTRFLDSITDTIILTLRRTIYADAKIENELDEGTKITYHFGRVLNYLQGIRNNYYEKKILKGDYRPDEVSIKDTDYVHALALKHSNKRETKHVIYRTLSFGLSLFCVGFILTIMYLLLVKH